MLRLPLLVVLLAAVIAVDSLFTGWWSVPLAGLVVGIASRRRPVLVAGGAAVLAWGALLLWSTLAARSETFALMARLGELIPVGGAGLYAATLLLAFLLAATAALLGAALRDLSGLGRVSVDVRVERRDTPDTSSSESAA